METDKKDFFWPSYVDLMTALFAVALIMFVFTYFVMHKKKPVNLKNKKVESRKDDSLLKKVRANLSLFESKKDIFYYNDNYKRIELKFQIQFNTGFDDYKIDSTHIKSDYTNTVKKLNILGLEIKDIIDKFKLQKESDPAMHDISYLMVISGTASHLRKDDDTIKNDLLSYERALYLYKYWKEKLGIDFDSPSYNQIIELQISGMGFGGLGRFNTPYDSTNMDEEKKNQRFIISIAPKINR